MTALKFAKPAPRRAEKRRKAAAHRAEMAQIREAVLLRAKGRCEHCGGVTLHMELDHQWGGAGRRREHQSIATCRLLCSPCHRAKTANEPSRERWIESWREHCARHGYSPDAPGLRKRGAA